MHISIDSMISLLQALQLVALAPCLFVIVFLLTTHRHRLQVVVPCLYFAALAASFILPLLELWPQLFRHPVYSGIIFAQTLLPALSFLLIIQFATGKVPPPLYWGILALPLIGGSGIVYASLLSDELCLPEGACFSAADIEGLYATIGNGFTFLLLMVIFAQTHHNARWRNASARNEYWLILALIGLNLCSMAVDLWQLHGTLAQADAVFIDTTLRMTFIYVVLTLLFRVFDGGRQQADMTAPPRLSPVQEQRDKDVVAAFEVLMQERQAYREMECNRESVARELGVSENMLSRIINQHYQARFTDVINQYRLKDAQRLLLADTEQSVTDIAFEVGFNSIPSFNRVFKENTGFSPTAFRATRAVKRRK